MFDERIKALRTSLGLNQVEFGRKINVTKQSVCNWENGNIMPSVEMLKKIATVYSVTTDYLLGISDKMTIDVEGLSNEEILHLQAIANDLKKYHN